MLLGGSQIAEIFAAGARSFPGPHGRLYLTVDSDPNGTITAVAGSIAILRNGLQAWHNADGAMTWVQIGGSVTPVGGLVTYADIDFRTLTPVNIKAGGDGIYAIGGIDFTAELTSTCLTSYVDSVAGLHVGCQQNGRFNVAVPLGHNISFIPRALFGSPNIGAMKDLWIWVALEPNEGIGRDYGAKLGPRIDLVGVSTFKSYYGNGIGNAFSTWKKAMSCEIGTLGQGVQTQDTTPTELVVPVGEFPVFVIRMINGTTNESFAGVTSGTGKIWPTRGKLSLRDRYSPTRIPSEDAGFGNTWVNELFHKVRLFPGTSADYYNETFVNFKMLKVEAEILTG